MTKRFATLLAMILFTSFSFAGRIEKSAVESKTKEKQEASAKLSTEQQKEELIKAIDAKMTGNVKKEFLQKGMDQVFGADLVKKIQFTSAIELLKAKNDAQATMVAKHVEQLLARIGSDMKADHKESAILLLKNFEMAMTEMGDAAVAKFEGQLAWTNILTFSRNKDGKALSGDEVQILAIANSFKVELNATLEIGDQLESKNYTKLDQLSVTQKAKAKAKVEEFKTACKG